ncbi:MAG: branched-chain amino acid ABC transporter permease [Desulfobacteraceae bacterium]|nr:branched-chain amino acid ABC transporter permease [Desulfobacteraceae bacterium]
MEPTIENHGKQTGNPMTLKTVLNHPMLKKTAFLTAAAGCVLLPHIMTDTYYLGIINYMILYVILCMGLNLILGYAGLLSLGHAAFYGLGGYTTAILITRYGFGFLSCLILSGAIALLFGILLGLPTRKVRGDYFCLLTIAFGEIFRLVAQAWIGFTNGAMGIVGIPIPSILGWSIRTEVDFYYLGLILLGFTWITLSLLVHSKFGRAFIAIREDELAASVMGINTAVYKIIVFGIGCFYAGLAGSYLAVYQTTVTPSNFRLEESCLMIIMVIVGGMGSLLAPIAGVIIMTLATEYFRGIAEYRMLIIGVIMVAVLLFRPQGIFGTSAFKG